MNIYVGNLPYSITEDELRQAFERYGEVSSAKIVIDRETGRSKGFGFVEMPDQGEAEAAVKALDGAPLNGRPARVNPPSHAPPGRAVPVGPDVRAVARAAHARADQPRRPAAPTGDPTGRRFPVFFLNHEIS